MSIKLAVLVSGRGSNLEAILKAIENGALDASVEIVLSNKAGVGALEIARGHGVRSVVVEHAGLGRVQHEENVLQELQKHSVDVLVLAGYMRVLSPVFLKQYRDDRGFFRIVNIHPSLLPAFPGKDAYQDAFDAGVKESGITVHLVDEEVDHGPILAQRAFPRLADDTIETFKTRGLQIEHALLPEVLQKISEKTRENGAGNGLSSLIKEHVAQ